MCLPAHIQYRYILTCTRAHLHTHTHTHFCVHAIHTCFCSYLPHAHIHSPLDIPPQTTHSQTIPWFIPPSTIYPLIPLPSEHAPVVYSNMSLHTYTKFLHMITCCVFIQNPIFPPSKCVGECALHTYAYTHIHLPSVYMYSFMYT